MRIKCLFVVLFLLFTSAGCMVERFPSANVATTPPYWQSQNQQSQNQLAEMRAFHEQESAKMTEDMHHFRNHEVERLQAAGKELEREQVTQKASEKTPVQKEKWSLFKKKDKDTPTVISLNSASGLVQ